MPHISITADAYAVLRAAAVARGVSNEDVVVDLLQRSLPRFDPGLLDVYPVGSVLVAYYAGRYAGVGMYAEPSSRDQGSQHQRAVSGYGSRVPVVDWCDWFAPIVAGQRRVL